MPRVLIVDDEPNQRRALSIGLRLSGFEVSTAASAVEALEVLRLVEVDIAMVDLMMPGLNGLELAKQFRVLHPTIPVVLTSAYHLTERQLERADVGVVGFVPKPCSMDALAIFLTSKVGCRAPGATQNA
jgi:CheY-like chemotaxis protein